ncbi:MAG: DUF2959 domain-containing protein [Phycisphaerae bacterium]|nr:DUF2959 domain-containing protein [Phycisphaerae bacterium]
MNTRWIAIIAVLVLGAMGCNNSLGYDLQEAMGTPKRQLMVSRVQDTRDSMKETKKTFASAMQQFGSVYKEGGSKLENKYAILKKEYENCNSRASELRSQIANVKSIGQVLFQEWQKELDQFTNEQMRKLSEVKMQQTREKYVTMTSGMDRVSARMTPALNSMNDQLLNIKHSLNALITISLEEELVQLRTHMDSLMTEIDAAVEHCNTFIGSMAEPK